MQNFQILGRKGEGTFSEVLKAEDRTTGQLVAIKCIKKRFKSMDQVNKLREILSIRRLQSHSNIVQLHSVLFDHNSGRLALVFELMDMNLYELIKDRKQYLPEDKVCNIAYQMLKGLEYIHSNGLLHRDIKPENLLFNVGENALKVADFGSSRGIYCNQPFTEYISTRWYRAPECLITDGYYSFKMDMWSAGCVLFEVMALFPLFPGNNELDQLHKIHNVLGTPPKELLDKLRAKGTHMDFDFPVRRGTGLQKLVPNASPDALDLLSKLLEYDEDKRITAKEALRHPYFKKMREMERKHKAAYRRQRTASTPTPTAPSGGKEASAGPMGGLATPPPPLVPAAAETHCLGRRSSGTGSRSGDAGDGGNALLPLIDAGVSPRSLKTSMTNIGKLPAGSATATTNTNNNYAVTGPKRHEIDRGDGTWKANSFDRHHKTRRLSLPKL